MSLLRNSVEPTKCATGKRADTFQASPQLSKLAFVKLEDVVNTSQFVKGQPSLPGMAQ